ncbi:hypothetical protein [Aureimonas phyllosphaerae]|uniref:Uncharacterized protein n=1 Tax=Aureimonas phyllosphaerae TaxID=1166078 RepID=A0A7W6C3B5_9HYPH|nr:hypothetical protein [Aureimonas phyllosphaerae]MBB3937677.1 hypothetical protein [Aureimonas phyllosphaerae]MBB3961788.1 hypothetical protein [Aureimonas phyllosphaerae]SFF44989.1 hypothetical protein SAMN05216566_11416 [Aureimonas phyllosphaerae]
MSVAAEYAALFDVAGRRVTLERYVDGAPVRVPNVRARVQGGSTDPIEVSAGNTSAERKVLILAADVPETFRPLRQSDDVLMDNLRLTFIARPDDQTHRDGAVLLAYDGVAVGS